MRKLYKQWAMLLLCMASCCSAAIAQIRVEIMVKSVYVDYTMDSDGSYGGRFRFYYNTPEDRCGPLLHPFCGDRDKRCIRTDGKSFSGDIWTPLNMITLSSGVTSFTLFMRTHHERQKDCTSRSSEECTVENLGCGHPDRHEVTSSMGVSLADFQPGVWTSLGRMVNQDDAYVYADLLIRYSVPTPVKPAPQPNPSLTTFCAQDVLELSTNVLPNNTGLQYQWQYALQSEDYEIWNPDKDPQNYEDPMYGCGHWEYDPWDGQQYWVWGGDCHLPDYITVHNWRSLPVTNSSSDRFAQFTPLHALFNNNITERSNVFFRTQATSLEGLTSPWSAESVYTILPAPPTLMMSGVEIKPSCIFPNNGRVTIPYHAISTPFTQVRWLLKNGHFNNGTCSIVFNGDGTITSTCGNIESQSNGLINVPKSAADAPIVIDNLPKGQYTLWLINPGENSGACYTPVNITIGEYPALTLDSLLATNLSCFGASDGVLRLRAGGGDPASGYQFKLVAKNHPALSFDFTTISGDVFERTGLPADEYTVYMKNACTPERSFTIVLTEPIRTKAMAVFNQPTCYNPANGSVVLDVSQGMGNYTYQLWNGGPSPVKETVAVPSTHLVFDQLVPGNYTARVLDAGRMSCPGWDTTVALVAPPVLGTEGLQVDSVTCYGGADGVVKVKGTGATGRYVFTLQRNGTTVSSNTDGVFSDLAAGTYSLITARPADENCNDTYVQTIIVPQRSPLSVASLTVVPVTCNGQDNGSIRVEAGGGSGSYAYYWEYWNGTAWQNNPFWFATDIQINDLAPGRYRVSISDNRSAANCKIVSEEITITEPAVLQIANVQPTDAACKDDGGRIKITAAGGNGGYQYYYSIDDRQHYTLFTENTPLTVNGDYYVKVVDAKGCFIESDGAYSISLPAIPMSFTLEAADYEGWSVSCFNGNNGRITVAASGGSGSGYEYQLGSGAFQSSPVFEQLAAGQYTVTVKDLRGCVISKTITLTQPPVPVQGTIIDKKEVDCPNTATGSFRIAVQNGRAPYQYSIDNGTHFQDDNAFTNLTTGTYQVVVKDKYNCTWTTSVTMVSLISPVQFTHNIRHVSCYNGNDGSVTVTAAAGVAPYQYQWENMSGQTNQLTALKAGNYILHLTDAAGCLNHDTVTIQQPAAALSAVVKTQPVCVGSKGSIAVTATGGTPPYRYSAGNNIFQDDPILGNLSAGSYTVVIKDHNNCETSYPVVINPANAMPEISFLVASGKNALDTLVIREISLPAPDSVQWSFDPAAQVLDAGPSPRIKFSQPGNYWVSMTGHFKGCAYTLRKTIYINPYDPDAGLVYTPPVHIIDTVALFPNPNSGQFSARVKMSRKQKLVMIIQDMGTGREVMRRSYNPSLITEDQFTLGSVAPGTYVLRVITENDSRDVLFIINR